MTTITILKPTSNSVVVQKTQISVGKIVLIYDKTICETKTFSWSPYSEKCALEFYVSPSTHKAFVLQILQQLKLIEYAQIITFKTCIAYEKMCQNTEMAGKVKHFVTAFAS